MGTDYSLYVTDTAYANTINREFDNMTVGYLWKHGAVVKPDGTLDFSKADGIFNKATASGLDVFGHCLVWHANNNATYLNSQLNSTSGTINLLVNGNFEAGSGNDFSNWEKLNGASGIVSTTSSYSGTRACEISSSGGNYWDRQLASGLFETTIGRTYKVTLHIKSSAQGGIGRISTRPTAQYQSDFNTATNWQEITWSFVAKDSKSSICLDMGKAVNTYYVDEVAVYEQIIPASVTTESIAKVDTLMKRWIKGMMGHYKGKVKAWDVVNEPMLDGSSGLRISGSTGSDTFYWSNYLGRNYALKAFQYAHEVDPNALLFINEYNLEYNPTKLDSLIAYVKQLRAKGAHIDGIGTQMHTDINNLVNVDQMFKKLAATGLLVRVSELDVRVNPSNSGSFVLSGDLLYKQSDAYGYIIKSYLNNIPAAQRHGFTIWGVTDADSWIVTVQKYADYPLLWDKSYKKKPAYFGLMKGIQGN